MQVWYLIRGGYQYGPYSAQDLLGMLAAGGLYPQDEFLESKSGRRYPIDKAVKKWRKTAGVRTKKRHTGLIVFGAIILLIGGFIGYKLLTKTSDHLTLGSSTAVASENIASDGGSITVSSGSLDGFAIDVPEGAYTNSTHFNISTRPINGHKFGSLFTPITPLITINNGGAFANESVTVTIPIDISDDEFAMGFYYDQKSGQLEGIPIVSEDNSQITLLTNHFCDIVVSEVKKANLAGLNVDTGFLPGYDDWQFTNRGSYIAPGGHCAGQSITAMWFFQEKYEDLHYPRLYGQFDNYDYGMTTNSFWWDDAQAYRFASVVQNEIKWGDTNLTSLKKLFNTDAQLTMNAFTYAMAMTGEPQYMSIGGDYVNADGETSYAGHAIIAYEIKDGCIYVSDPNYPGNMDRCVIYDGAGFEAYSSGLNANDIESGNGILFTKINYVATSAMIDYSQIEEEYEKMLNKTSGDKEFPVCTMQLAVPTGVLNEFKWVDCPEEVKIDSAENAKMGEKYRNKIKVCVSTPYSGLKVVLAKGLNDCKPISSQVTDGEGKVYFDAELTPGINDIGFFVYYPETKQDGSVAEVYIDFMRVKVEFDLTAEMWFEQDSYDVICQTETAFTVKTKDAPPDVTYEWDFGDGSALETEVPSTDYTYQTGGEYVISCTMVSNKDGKVLAEARAAVNAVELFGTWNFSYTITESGAVDYIANFFGDMLLGLFKQIFPDQGVPDSANITVAGTVVSGTLTIEPPPDSGSDNGKIFVELQQLSSSTDFIEVETTPIPGYLTLDGNYVTINLTGEQNDSNTAAAMKFEGLLSNGIMSGTFSASGVMSGDFEAKK